MKLPALSVYQGPVCLESNWLGTVNALKASSPDISSSSFVIEEVKRILSLFQNSRVSFCHRSANEVAHVLGQISRRDQSSDFIS
jgi:hypothetical protein